MTICIVCGSDKVEQFLDLGETALANKFLAKEDLSKLEPKYPLRVGFCHNCGHVQLMESVPPIEMFEDYLYISSMSDTLKDHLYDLARVVSERFQLGVDDLVVDIGSNDGTLLSEFKRCGVKTLGVDPAKNLADRARQVGVETYSAYFGERTAGEIKRRWGTASAVTATNTFLHIPDLGDFLRGIDILLSEDGVFVIEAHYLVDILDQVAFDTVYHEHVSYWGLMPMKWLFEQNGLQVVDVKRLPLHHGQLQVFVQRIGQGIVRPQVAEILELEKARGTNKFETFQEFARKSREIKRNLQETVDNLRNQGKRVAGYGAPAKGNTLLSYLGIGPDKIEYIVDRSPLKQGLYTPGMHIPVVSPSRLIDDRPDYVILFAWNFADEVMEQQSEYRRRGGKFILPVPQVKII